MTDVATHCKHCGQKLQPYLIERVPFTKDVLMRIKSGATARELGWDQTFYIAVCRKHGLTPNVQPPQTQAPSEIAPSVPLAPPTVAADAKPVPPTGPCTFHPAHRELYREGLCLKLPLRMAEVFAYIAKGTPVAPANGVKLNDKIPGAGGIIYGLRPRLLPLNLKIEASRTIGNSGYWLVDLTTTECVKVRRVGAKS